MQGSYVITRYWQPHGFPSQRTDFRGTLFHPKVLDSEWTEGGGQLLDLQEEKPGCYDRRQGGGCLLSESSLSFRQEPLKGRIWVQLLVRSKQG